MFFLSQWKYRGKSSFAFYELCAHMHLVGGYLKKRVLQSIKLKRSIGYRAVEAELSIYYIDYTVTQNEHVIMQVRVSGGGMGKDSSSSLLTFFNALIVFNHKWRAEALYQNHDQWKEKVFGRGNFFLTNCIVGCYQDNFCLSLQN